MFIDMKDTNSKFHMDENNPPATSGSMYRWVLLSSLYQPKRKVS